MSLTIRPMRREDVPQAVSIHMAAFSSFFLTFLGPRFLLEFYRAFLDDDAGMAFVATDSESGEILGVVVGPTSPAGFFKRLLKRRWTAFLLASISAIFRKPTIIARLLRAVLYRGDAPPGGDRALLSSIAVLPKAQGRGVGRALIEAWLSEAKRRGVRGAFLTTDACDNDSTNRFYQRLGWDLETSFTTPQGREMNRYVVDFFPD